MVYKTEGCLIWRYLDIQMINVLIARDVLAADLGIDVVRHNFGSVDAANFKVSKDTNWQEECRSLWTAVPSRSGTYSLNKCHQNVLIMGKCAQPKHWSEDDHKVSQRGIRI